MKTRVQLSNIEKLKLQQAKRKQLVKVKLAEVKVSSLTVKQLEELITKTVNKALSPEAGNPIMESIRDANQRRKEKEMDAKRKPL